MKRILTILAFVLPVLAMGQDTLLKKNGVPMSVNDSTTDGRDSLKLVTSRAVYDDLNNVYDTRGKLLNLHKKVLNGSLVSGIIPGRGDIHIRHGWFGDSMGAYVASSFGDKGVAMFGFGGGIMNTVNHTGGASTHSNVGETDYWFNGTWYVVPSGGTTEFLYGGGRMQANILKIYYVKESGAGTFQLQLNSGSGYANEGSVVDANDATTQAGIITLNKPATTYGVKIVGVTGTVRIIMVLGFNEQSGIDSWCNLNLAVGGLQWGAANATPRAITNPIFADLGLDLATIQFKENGNIYSTFKSWLDDFRTVATTTDWILIGSGPQLVDDGANKADNATLRKISLEDTLLYYDGYSPLISFARLQQLGWPGDNLHLDNATGYLHAMHLWQIVGIDKFLLLGPYFGTTKNKDARFTGARGVAFDDASNNGFYNGKIAASSSAPDLLITLRRWLDLRNTSNTQMAHFDPNSGWSIDANKNTRGYGISTTAIPGSSFTGLYFRNDSTAGIYTNVGSGRAGNFEARTGRFDSLYIGTAAFSSPSASSVAEFNSVTKGILIPRMSAAQRLAISSPANGLMVWDTDSSRIMMYNTNLAIWRGLRFTNEMQTIAPTANPGDSSSAISTMAALDKVKDSLASVIPAILTQTTTLDFPSTAVGTSQDLTITVTGASLGDPVTVGKVGGYACCDSTAFIAFVSSANTVTVRFLNMSAVPIDPAADNFKVKVLK